MQVWHLATLGFDVTVAHVIAGERFFASDGADLGHIRSEKEKVKSEKLKQYGSSLTKKGEFGKVGGCGIDEKPNFRYVEPATATHGRVLRQGDES